MAERALYLRAMFASACIASAQLHCHLTPISIDFCFTEARCRHRRRPMRAGIAWRILIFCASSAPAGATSVPPCHCLIAGEQQSWQESFNSQLLGISLKGIERSVGFQRLTVCCGYHANAANSHWLGLLQNNRIKLRHPRFHLVQAWLFPSILKIHCAHCKQNVGFEYLQEVRHRGLTDLQGLGYQALPQRQRKRPCQCAARSVSGQQKPSGR